MLIHQNVDKCPTPRHYVNAPDNREYIPLTASEIVSLTPALTGDRMNLISAVVITNFIKGRNLRVQYKEMKSEISDLENLYREKESVPEPNRNEDMVNWMLDCQRNMRKKQMALDEVRADIDILEQNTDRVHREVIEISHFHQNSWNYTQVVMDMIEAGRKNPLHERWS